MDGAFTSYQSFFEKGSTLQETTKFDLMPVGMLLHEQQQAMDRTHGSSSTHIFFFPPFLPLLMRLFLPAKRVNNQGAALAPAGSNTGKLCDSHRLPSCNRLCSAVLATQHQLLHERGRNCRACEAFHTAAHHVRT
jgi:hypothetical protein